MPTLDIQSTNGAQLTVIYPAEKPPAQSAVVRLRMGKKNVLPTFTEQNPPYLVQFKRGQRIFMFMLSDLFETSFWQRIRNAYDICGRLEIDDDIRIGSEETERLKSWLFEQAASLGVTPENGREAVALESQGA